MNSDWDLPESDEPYCIEEKPSRNAAAPEVNDLRLQIIIALVAVVAMGYALYGMIARLEKLIVHAVPSSVQRTPSEIYQSVSHYVVSVAALDKEDTVLTEGTGVCWNKFTIVTVAHLATVREAVSLRVTFHDGTQERCKSLERLDTDADLASLSSPDFSEHVPQTRLAKEGLQFCKPSIGTRCYAIGDAMGLRRTFTEGLISGIREVEGVTYLQTSAPINRGCSGGPLLSGDGKLLGVMSSGLDEANGIGFVISMGDVEQFMERPIRTVTIAEASTMTVKRGVASESVHGAVNLGRRMAYKEVLHGLRRLAIIVECATEMDAEPFREVLNMAAKRCGIEVVPQTEDNDETAMILNLGMYTEQVSGKAVLTSAELELRQWVATAEGVAQKEQMRAATWFSGPMIGTVRPEVAEAALLEAVTNITIEFVEEWKQANQ